MSEKTETEISYILLSPPITIKQLMPFLFQAEKTCGLKSRDRCFTPNEYQALLLARLLPAEEREGFVSRLKGTTIHVLEIEAKDAVEHVKALKPEGWPIYVPESAAMANDWKRVFALVLPERWSGHSA